MNEIINIALIGYGNIGRRHAAVIASHPFARLTAIVDPALVDSDDSEIAQYTSVDSFLTQDKITDAVVIATPNGLHYEHAKACLMAGKHVLVEKPVALYADQVSDLMHIAQQQQVCLKPVWQIRHSPVIRQLKECFSDGSLGNVLWVQADCFWNRGEQYYHNHPWHGKMELDGGPLYTQFSHVIDLLIWLLGDCEAAESSFFKLRDDIITDFEDSGSILLKFNAEQQVGVINYTTSAPEGTSSNELTIITDTVKIQLEGKYFEKVKSLQPVNKINAMQLSGEQPRDYPDDIASYCSFQLLNQYLDNVQRKLLVNHDDLFLPVSLIENIYQTRPSVFQSQFRQIRIAAL
ncbi:Gfo/Idh/MocA family oxidoreductase (plasmid) [Pedobacter sp. BS3]|uniref:Gfo/Idh/MocA family protein n=1 Tax=Pedobacter sp. BS3 TaxID=2567937 RepID=UPI0011EC5147|nr:Gfo/Idh/MocA family oxidoreductase [Pedobacter sp. BS3]TZF86436.1 Gfo/Idh/MocA family oxidoreductase [Pedobacter sp. BS3]